MDEETGPILPAMLDKRHREVMAFLAEYSEITTIVDTALLTINALAFGSTLQHGSESLARAHCGVMWQTAADYQKQSLIHILARELDAGFALLRMATELARDAYVIGNNNQLLQLWINREKRASEYRKKFKFNESVPGGAAAFDLYKFCSQFGVHGHTTSTMHADLTGEATTDGSGVVINTDQRAIFSGLRIWLRAIFSIHCHFCEAFHLNRPPVGEGYSLFMEFVSSLDPFITAVDQAAETGSEMADLNG